MKINLKILIAIKMALVMFVVFALCQCGDSRVDKIDHELKVYKQALKLGDINTAISAMLRIASYDTNEVSYYDSLSTLYYMQRNYPASYKSAYKVLQRRPSESAYDAAFRSARELRMNKEALDFALKLKDIRKEDLRLLYDIGVLYFSLGERAKAIEYMDKIILDEGSKKLIIEMNSEGKMQKVVARSLALTNKGFMLMELNKLDEAETFLKEALKVQDHPLARNNLTLLYQLKKKAK
jgi:tetratricopeptide (TPR) repeat protein